MPGVAPDLFPGYAVVPHLKLARRLADLSKSPTTATTGRADIAKVAFEAFRNNWVLGVGIGQLPSQFPYYATMVESYGFAIRRMDAHNTYLSVLAESGLPGFIFFIMILYCLYKGRRKGKFLAPVEENALVIVLLFLTSSAVYGGSKFYWLVMLVIYLTRSFTSPAPCVTASPSIANRPSPGRGVTP